MKEAYDIFRYLPISYRDQNEQNYVQFLWDAYDSNCRNQKYQFAYLAYHMLTMCCIYFNIWQIRSIKRDVFEYAMVGFNKDLEAELLSATSPFVLWRVNESTVVRFLKLIGCRNDKIGRCVSLIKGRNESAHANGNIFYSDARSLEVKIDEILVLLQDIEDHSRPVIETCYIDFLESSRNPEEREYESDIDQVREILLHQNYFSQQDIKACIDFDLSRLSGRPGFNFIESLHRTLRDNYSEQQH
jgi:hypothetical protein